MNSPFINNKPQIVLGLAASGKLSEPFALIDIGASGGISSVWYAFGQSLVAYGFDRLVNEVDRLNAAKPQLGSVEYIAAEIVRAPGEPPISAPRDMVYNKSSTQRSVELLGLNWTQVVNNFGAELVYAKRRLSVDEFARERGLTTVDFIKTDTDGYDYSILLGAEETLRDRNVLGLAVEVNFNTAPHPEANLFANHDLYLRSLGFSLFDLDVRRYTRAALPGKFLLNLPSPTESGQPCQGDAIYLRDFADPDFERAFPHIRPTLPRLLKMVSLFEIFGLNDCAVELIEVYRDTIAPHIDIEQLCSMLSQEAHGVPDYASFMRGFEHCVRSARFSAFPEV